ncbi:MAG: hypothetical protein ACK5NB_07355 [Flavobacteriaceae bacterium]
MRKAVYLLIIVLMSCNDESKPNLISFIEDKVWIHEKLKHSVEYYSKGFMYIFYTKDNSVLKDKRLDLYLDGDNPENPKENSLWTKYSYYKTSKDTLFTQNINDGSISCYNIKIEKDTTIGILEYYKIQVTALRKEGDVFKKGLTFNMISKKN